MLVVIESKLISGMFTIRFSYNRYLGLMKISSESFSGFFNSLDCLIILSDFSVDFFLNS